MTLWESETATTISPVDGALIARPSTGARAGSGSPDGSTGSGPTSSGPPAQAPAPDPVTASAFEVLDDRQELVLLDRLPVAALLMDETASVRYLNDTCAQLLGQPREELLGRSVLDFVSVDHLDFVVELMKGTEQFGNKVLGPNRVKYVTAAGEEHWTQVWARNAPPEVCPGGFIVTVTSESVRDVLSATATSVGTDSTLDWTLAGVAESTRGLPLDASGAVLAVEASASSDQRVFRVIGDWPVDRSLIDDPSMPWRAALESGQAYDIADLDDSALPGSVRMAFARVGIHALFVRPMGDADRGETNGVFAVFRRAPGPASANMNDHIEEALRLAQVAFTMARRQSELEMASHRDALTGLANRAAFNDRLRAERRATDVLFVDLDHFKQVNDTHGHEVGDRVLSMAAERMESTLRRDAQVFRIGGDEFIVLCESTGDDPAERIALAERIVDVLMTPFDVNIHRVRIGATVGIAASGSRSLVDTVRAADGALYRAKKRGRSGWAHEGR